MRACVHVCMCACVCVCERSRVYVTPPCYIAIHIRPHHHIYRPHHLIAHTHTPTCGKHGLHRIRMPHVTSSCILCHIITHTLSHHHTHTHVRVGSMGSTMLARNRLETRGLVRYFLFPPMLGVPANAHRDTDAGTDRAPPCTHARRHRRAKNTGTQSHARTQRQASMGKRIQDAHINTHRHITATRTRARRHAGNQQA